VSAPPLASWWLGIGALALAAFAGAGAGPGGTGDETRSPAGAAAEIAPPTPPSADAQARIASAIAAIDHRFKLKRDADARRDAAWQRAAADRLDRWQACRFAGASSCGSMPPGGP
jgi:hypothetical protein